MRNMRLIAVIAAQVIVILIAASGGSFLSKKGVAISVSVSGTNSQTDIQHGVAHLRYDFANVETNSTYPMPEIGERIYIPLVREYGIWSYRYGATTDFSQITNYAVTPPMYLTGTITGIVPESYPNSGPMMPPPGATFKSSTSIEEAPAYGYKYQVEFSGIEDAALLSTGQVPENWDGATADLIVNQDGSASLKAVHINGKRWF
jgi:hypothetical protein